MARSSPTTQVTNGEGSNRAILLMAYPIRRTIANDMKLNATELDAQSWRGHSKGDKRKWYPHEKIRTIGPGDKVIDVKECHTGKTDGETSRDGKDKRH